MSIFNKIFKRKVKNTNENGYWKNLPDRYYLVNRRAVLKVSQGVTVYSLNSNGSWSPNQYAYSHLNDSQENRPPLTHVHSR